MNTATYPTPLHPAIPPLPIQIGFNQYASNASITNLFIKVRKEKVLPIISCNCFVLEMFNVCTKVLIKYFYRYHESSSVHTMLLLPYLVLLLSSPNSKEKRTLSHMEQMRKNRQGQCPLDQVLAQSVDYHYQIALSMMTGNIIINNDVN